MSILISNYPSIFFEFLLLYDKALYTQTLHLSILILLHCSQQLALVFESI